MSSTNACIRFARRHPRRGATALPAGSAHADGAVRRRLTELVGVPVHLKLEHHQTTGSFKLRGATNAVAVAVAGENARAASSRPRPAITAGRWPMRQSRRAASRPSACRGWCRRTRLRKSAASVPRSASSAAVAGRGAGRGRPAGRGGGLVMVPPFDHPAVDRRAGHARPRNHRGPAGGGNGAGAALGRRARGRRRGGGQGAERRGRGSSA